MTPTEFAALAAQGYNRIPIMREVLADLDTPLSTYLKLAEGPYTYLFESVQGGEKWGRYSFIGLPCREVIRVDGSRIRHYYDGKQLDEQNVADPLTWIGDFAKRFIVPNLPGLPRFNGGLVGYFGYDCVRLIEPKLAGVQQADPLQVPDIVLMVSDEILAFDNLSGKLYLIVHADPVKTGAYANAQARIEQLITMRHAALPRQTHVEPAAVTEADFISGLTQQGFEQAVDKIKAYIRAGDVMQVVLSQRMSIPFAARPIDLYRALRSLNPSPYMFHLHLGDFDIVGSSPEILVRLEDGVVTVRPIAGTRPRGKTESEDLALERELLADPKEIAEHLMLIDLGRNDIGRIAQTGSVRLTDKMIVERYSHVMHIVSNVTGQLKPGMSAIDVLRATFPAGTVSGAPKIRAMQIIDELEPVKRGVYAGAVGYLGWSGNMDTAIAIRTAVIKDRLLHIQAGAGVVYDSVPRNEWHETLNKGRAMFRAVAKAVAGLDNPST